MEHTPKNILIRAVKREKRRENTAQKTGIKEMTEFLQVNTCLQRLFEKQEHS